MENIPARLCNGLNGLKSLSIPHSVKLIGENAFSGCDSLTNLVWNADSCLTNGNMPTSNIEQVTIGNGVENLPNNFVSGSKITAVSLPSTLKAISNYAFYGCSGLTKVRIPASVSAIGDAAFTNCSGMESVSIGTSVESIGNSAFSGCSSLASLTIPSSVATIGSYAFSGCSSLTKVTIPSSLTELGGSAFNECSGLYKIYWNVINHNDYNSDSSPFKGLTNITEFKVGNGVEKIPAYLCEGLSGLTSLILPSSLLSIGEEAFSGCNGLTSVNFPSSMKSIGEQAFYGCSLTSVTIPNSVDSIGINPFNGCSELSSITVESGNSNYDSRDNCNAIIETQSNNLISGCKNTVVPTTVKKIGNYSFAWNTGFTTINIPNSVTSIGYAAFAECTNLNSITIPNSVIDIDTCAFSDCVGLTSVVIPNSVKSIEAGAFQYCSGLSSVSIGNSVELIGTSAFYSCSSLSSISIPSSVLSVGAYAFQGCSGLTTVTWNVKNGNGYSNYRQSPFFALSNIRSFIFGNEVEVIPNNLCYGLSGLTSIILPNSVTSIASNAFYAAWNSSHPLSTLTLTGKGEWNYNSDALYGLSRIMSKFKTVNIGSEITSLSNFGFTPETINCYAAAAPACQEGTFANYNGELHVPLTSTVGYFTSDYWQNFTNMINDLSDKVTLDQTSADLLQDETLQLTATTIPVGSNLIWSSSNSSIATVSDDGVVNVSGFGECDIFATLESNYAAYASCHVNVSVSSMAITLNKDNAILGANQMLTVYPSCTPDVPVELVVTSSDPSVAVARVVNRTNAPAAGLKSFPEKGMALAHFNSMESPFSKAPAYASEKAIVIVGVQNGTATITVTTADGKAEPAVLELRVADVNGDNVVTASDVTELYNYLLNNDETYIATGDVNGDGNITAADVTEIYNILLGN